MRLHEDFFCIPFSTNLMPRCGEALTLAFSCYFAAMRLFKNFLCTLLLRTLSRYAAKHSPFRNHVERSYNCLSVVGGANSSHGGFYMKSPLGDLGARANHFATLSLNWDLKSKVMPMD